MNSEEMRQWVEERSHKYIAMYGLSHWNISIEVLDDEDPVAVGDCVTETQYDKATINLYAEGIMDEAELHETLCHELEHILTSSYDLYKEAVNQVIPPRLRQVTDNLYMNCVEMARNNIGRFRANLLFSPLD